MRGRGAAASAGLSELPPVGCPAFLLAPLGPTSHTTLPQVLSCSPAPQRRG